MGRFKLDASIEASSKDLSSDFANDPKLIDLMRHADKHRLFAIKRGLINERFIQILIII